MAKPELAGRVTLNDSQALAALTRLDRTGTAVAAKLGLSFQNFGRQLGAVAAVGAGLFAGRSLVQGLDRVFEAGRALQILSRQTGAGVQGLALLQEKFKAAGLDGEQVATSIFRLQKSIAGVEDEENKGGAGRLRELGLNLAQLARLSPDKQLFAVGRAISTIRDPAERSATAMQIFGRAGAQLGALFEGGSFANIPPELQERAATLARNSALFEQVVLKLQRAGSALNGFFLGIADRVGTSLQPILDKLDKMDLVSIGQAFGDALAGAADKINAMLDNLKTADLVSIGKQFGQWLALGVSAVTQLMADLGQFTKATAGEISGIAKFFGMDDPFASKGGPTVAQTMKTLEADPVTVQPYWRGKLGMSAFDSATSDGRYYTGASEFGQNFTGADWGAFHGSNKFGLGDRYFDSDLESGGVGGGAYGATGNIWNQVSGRIGRKGADPVEKISGHVASMAKDIAETKDITKKAWGGSGGTSSGGGGATTTGK